MINIDDLLLTSAKQKDALEREAYKMIKAKFQEWQTSKQNVGKKMSDIDQISILKKLKDEYEEDAKMYALIPSGWYCEQQYEDIASIICALIPAEASEADIEAYVDTVMSTTDNPRMGDVIKTVIAEFPGTDGKTIAAIVKKRF